MQGRLHPCNLVWLSCGTWHSLLAFLCTKKHWQEAHKIWYEKNSSWTSSPNIFVVPFFGDTGTSLSTEGNCPPVFGQFSCHLWQWLLADVPICGYHLPTPPMGRLYELCIVWAIQSLQHINSSRSWLLTSADCTYDDGALSNGVFWWNSHYVQYHH